jgi:hypothetical protein
VKLGFLTSCMPERSLEDIAAWAAANRFEALELAAWGVTDPATLCWLDPPP